MSRKSKCDKSLSTVRPTFTLFRNRCPLCLKIYQKSKYFATLYGLQYHLNTHQKNDDVATSGISLDEIKNVISQIAQGIQWGMVLN
jgi:hypothetical protein